MNALKVFFHIYLDYIIIIILAFLENLGIRGFRETILVMPKVQNKSTSLLQPLYETNTQMKKIVIFS